MFKSFLSSAVLFLALPCALLSGADPHWDIQYRYRQVDSALTINDIAFPSATRGIVCGFAVDHREKERPLVLLTSDGGQHWSETPVKETGLSLFFLDDSTGWMVTKRDLGDRRIGPQLDAAGQIAGWHAESLVSG